MINMEKMRQVLTQYKTDFPTYWKDEEYKWEAVRHFKDKWNIDAENFGEMFKEATKKTGNLLDSGHSYPRAMIGRFAQADAEATREMFRALFDDSTDLTKRVKAFQVAADEMRAKHDDGTWWNHFQNTNAISTYLWLHDPDRYFIYKYQLVKAAAAELGSDFTPRADGSIESMIGGYRLYDEIRAAVKADESVCGLIRDAVNRNPDCYPDPEYVTTAIDVAYYLAKRYGKAQDRQTTPAEVAEPDDEWFPQDYSPLSVEEWLELLKDGSVFTPDSMRIMARMMDYGGEATCKQLSERYGKDPNFYNSGSSNLAKRIWKKTQCKLWSDADETRKWWPILYLGKNAEQETAGVFVWRLRNELREALEQDGGWRQYLAVPYTEQDFFENDKVYMDKSDYRDLKELLLFKKNVILQGAPGVGKTFAAKKLAYSILGQKDDSRIEFVQFHQNCTYEDFVMGYRPKGDKFKLKTGVFLNFCREAAGNPDSRYFFIIDEINRGNMSKIFGELLMLIENDKRGKDWSVELAYGNDPEENDGQEEAADTIPQRFFVPENVYIIGMMNTADRSLAMIDYALRRRFSFFEMKPAFDSEGFRAYQRSIGSAKFDKLIKTIQDLNDSIEKDPALGSGFRIGHSYFCNRKPDEVSGDWMKRIVKYEIIPLLQEYWFDEPSKWKQWRDDLEKCLGSEADESSAPPRASAVSGGSDQAEQ